MALKFKTTTTDTKTINSDRSGGVRFKSNVPETYQQETTVQPIEIKQPESRLDEFGLPKSTLSTYKEGVIKEEDYLKQQRAEEYKQKPLLKKVTGLFNVKDLISGISGLIKKKIDTNKPEAVQLMDQHFNAMTDYYTEQLSQPGGATGKSAQEIEKIIKDDLGSLDKGVVGIVAHTFLPTRVITENLQAKLKNAVVQQSLDDYAQKNPIPAIIGETVGGIANLILFKEMGAGFGLSGKVGEAAGGLRNLYPTLTRIAGYAAEGGSIFGIERAVNEAFNQIQSGKLNTLKIATEGMKGAGTGALISTSGALPTLGARVAAGGTIFAGLTTAAKLIQDGKLNSKDLVDIAVSGLVGSLFELTGGTKRSGILRGQELEQLNKDIIISRIMGNNPKLTRAEAEKMAILMEDLPRAAISQLSENQQTKIKTELQKISEQIKGKTPQQQKVIFNKIIDNIKAGNSIITPTIEFTENILKNYEQAKAEVATQKGQNDPVAIQNLIDAQTQLQNYQEANKENVITVIRPETQDNYAEISVVEMNDNKWGYAYNVNTDSNSVASNFMSNDFVGSRQEAIKKAKQDVISWAKSQLTGADENIKNQLDTIIDKIAQAEPSQQQTLNTEQQQKTKIPTTKLSGLGFMEVEVPVAKAVEATAKENSMSSGFHTALNQRWTIVYKNPSKKLISAAEQAGLEVSTRETPKGSGQILTDVSLPNIGVKDQAHATRVFNDFADIYSGEKKPKTQKEKVAETKTETGLSKELENKISELRKLAIAETETEAPERKRGQLKPDETTFDKELKIVNRQFGKEIYSAYKSKYGEYPIGFISLSDSPFEWKNEKEGSILFDVAQAETDQVETQVAENLDDVLTTLRELKSRGRSSEIIQSDIQYEVERTRPTEKSPAGETRKSKRIGLMDYSPTYTPRMNQLIKEAQDNGDLFPYTKMTPEEQKIVDNALRDALEEMPTGKNKIDEFTGKEIQQVAVADIIPEERGRVKQETIDQVVADKEIKRPVLLRKQGDKYLIVDGANRVEGAKQLGLKTVPSVFETVEPETKPAEPKPRFAKKEAPKAQKQSAKAHFGKKRGIAPKEREYAQKERIFVSEGIQKPFVTYDYDKISKLPLNEQPKTYRDLENPKYNKFKIVKMEQTSIQELEDTIKSNKEILKTGENDFGKVDEQTLNSIRLRLQQSEKLLEQAKQIQQRETATAERELADEVDKFIGEVSSPPLGLSLKEVKEPRFGETKTTQEKFTFENSEIEARYQKSKGLQNKKNLFVNIQQHITDIYHSLTREHKGLPRLGEYAQLQRWLRTYLATKEVTNDKAARILQGITIGLNSNQFDLFSRKVLLNDLAQEAKTGHKLPFGFNHSEVISELGRVDAKLDEATTNAINKRNKFIEALQKDLVKYDILSEDQLKEDYFHHQVIQYAIERPRIMGTGTRLRQTRHGYAKQRGGSEMDINADYLQAEFEVIAQGLLDIETAKTVREIENSKYNIRPRISQKLSAINRAVKDKTIDEKTAQQILDQTLIKNPTSSDQRAINDAINLMIEDAKRGALSDKWEDYVPSDWTTWQPREGNVFYHATSLPEKIMLQLQSDLMREASITKEDLKTITALGGKRKQFVLSENVADALSNLRNFKERGAFNNVFREITRSWKAWVLFNPRRAIKYNLQNMAGDFDALIAGNPGALKYVNQSIKELYEVFYGKKSMTENMRDFFERGGLSSNLTIQEVPDISTLKIFEELFDKSQKENLWQKIGAKSLFNYFNAVKDFSSFRENWFRYAAYLDYINKLNNNQPTGYGASIPEEIDAIENDKDKAAKLATELLGDYQAISQAGKEIRDTIIPFYSWLEINFRRYTRLFKNVFKSNGAGGVPGLAGRLALGAGTKLGVRLGFLMLRMAALWLAFQLWNKTFFGDEERELSDYDRARMHLNLGRNKNGEVKILRVQGAFGDFLQWFGMDDFITEIQQLNDGQISWGDILENKVKAPVNKLMQAITPLYKMPVEILTKRSFFPDTFNPSIVRDPARNIAKSLSLENEYDLLFNKPSRGYLRSWTQSVITSFDPDETAYYDIVALKYDFMEKNLGVSGSSDFTSPRSEAYREYKQALRFKDKEAEENAVEKMRKLGIEYSDLQRSLDAADPLSGLSNENEDKFIDWLNGFQKEKLKRAQKYYEETFQDADQPEL